MIINVLVIAGWSFDNFLRQTPKEDGNWGNYKFYIHSSIENIDYSIEYQFLICIYHLPGKLKIRIPEGNTIFITQEPPYDAFLGLNKMFNYFDTVITQFEENKKNSIKENPMIPWWIGKSYSELKNMTYPEKGKELSWITSNKTMLPGHKERLAFKNILDKSNIKYDLYGNGFQYIESKWDGLANYKYSLAIENGCFPHYWTEKFTDCILSNTLPFYYGCPDILNYFPNEAMVQIDIFKPHEAIEIIKNTLDSNQWEKSQDALRYSRELILDKYQFFPFMSNFMEGKTISSKKKTYYFPIYGWPKVTMVDKINRKLKALLRNK